MKNWVIPGFVLALAVLATVVTARPDDVANATSARAGQTPATHQPTAALPSRAAPRGRAAFVGSAACAACHQEQARQYAGSHHAKALVTPTADVAKARFDGAKFSSKLGGATTFALRDGSPVVSTRAGGKTETFPITYISGVWPLEQYVVSTGRGKLQSLGVIWDSRSETAPENRWLHVYGRDGIAPGDPLFFTSAAQNWNHVCADCHSTLVERRYDAATDRFDTRWAEESVGCEACHGPGAEHVRSARAGGPVTRFSASLEPSRPWAPSVTGSPTPRPRDGQELEVCAPCHSRRKPLREGFVASDPFLDSFEPELLRPGRYHADGQVEGEVYEWASFQQSRMHQAGVRCSDCHNPHSGKPYAIGNDLCVRCHEPARFNVPAHSHHPSATSPSCIDCHMPPGTFMQIDERRDHSLRIPRPDLSVELGTPNACNACHAKQTVMWARDTLASWFPASKRRDHFALALAKERKGALDAPRALRALAQDPSAPAIARATALESLGHYPNERSLQTLQTALASPEPLLVYGAVLGAAQLPPAERAPLLLGALQHAQRAGRVAAGKALASVRVAELPESSRTALERAFADVEASFEVGASRADTHVERSAFELARGKLAEAEASLQTALRLQPCLAEAYLNLADLERQRGDEAAAERAIRSALTCSPENAAAHHALGLWQVRARQPKPALASLKRAAELAPFDPRFRYVLAVALAGSGDRGAAIRALEAGLESRPNDARALQALAGYLWEDGQGERAREARRQLEEVMR